MDFKYILGLIFCISIILVSCGESSESDRLINLFLEQGSDSSLEITYPRHNTLFPPEIMPPVFIWNDNNKSNKWLAFVKLDQEIIFKSEYIDTNRWSPDSASWEMIKGKSLEKDVTVTILGFYLKETKKTEIKEITSSASIVIKTSKDSVGAPIFYRAVPLPFSFAIDNLGTIQWRLGDLISRKEPPIVLQDMPVCGNCHSFSLDGKKMGMDVDYGNDKGSYYVHPINKQMKMEYEDIITWSDYKKDDGEKTYGLLSQISPDGRWVLSTVKDRSVFVRIDDFNYSQLFFPIKGIIGVYDTKTKQFSALPGADDPDFCQSNPSWSPDGKEILFVKAPYYKLQALENSKEAVVPTQLASDFTEGKKDYKYDIYKIPFNGGKGGVAVPVEGASMNGKSNYFPKFSPDGKWIVFTQANNFMLLQPDSKLFIVSAKGGKPREMTCNNPNNSMNSWHSWSPNGKWLVFSSKHRGPFTRLYLTHVDEKGMDTPPVILDNFSIHERAANIPEFVNIKYGGIAKILEHFMDNDSYSFIRGKEKLNLGDLDGALRDVNKSIEIDPRNEVNYNLRALIKIEKGDYKGAIVDFSKVIEMTPDRFDAYANRATAKFNMNDFPGAVEDLDKTIHLNPKGSRAYYSRGSAKYNSGDYTGAVSDYTECIKLSPDNKEAWFERGIAKLQLEKIVSACEDLKKAKELGNEKAQKFLDEYCK